MFLLCDTVRPRSAEPHLSSLWSVGLSGDLEPCFLTSLLKFRHVRVKVDCLHALLQAGVGSLKLTLVEYSSASHIAFILGQWQLAAVGCSSQLFTMWCQLAHNKFYPILSFASTCILLKPFVVIYCFLLLISLWFLFFLSNHLPSLACPMLRFI